MVRNGHYYIQPTNQETDTLAKILKSIPLSEKTVPGQMTMLFLPDEINGSGIIHYIDEPDYAKKGSASGRAGVVNLAFNKSSLDIQTTYANEAAHVILNNLAIEKGIDLDSLTLDYPFSKEPVPGSHAEELISNASSVHLNALLVHQLVADGLMD